MTCDVNLRAISSLYLINDLSTLRKSLIITVTHLRFTPMSPEDILEQNQLVMIRRRSNVSDFSAVVEHEFSISREILFKKEFFNSLFAVYLIHLEEYLPRYNVLK